MTLETLLFTGTTSCADMFSVEDRSDCLKFDRQSKYVPDNVTFVEASFENNGKVVCGRFCSKSCKCISILLVNNITDLS